MGAGQAMDPNLAGEFSGRYTHPLHIVAITPAKILIHPPRCPYRGNASALRASRVVHNNNFTFFFIISDCPVHQIESDVVTAGQTVVRQR